MDLSTLKPAAGSVPSGSFRKGRGAKHAGKGTPGQQARSGAPRIGFEGGQMPLYRRLPKRGFKNIGRAQIETIKLSHLEKFDEGADVTIEALLEKGIIRDPKDGVKVLGNGELTKKLNVSVTAYSASAKARIEELGGKAEVL